MGSGKGTAALPSPFKRHIFEKPLVNCAYILNRDTPESKKHLFLDATQTGMQPNKSAVKVFSVSARPQICMLAVVGQRLA